MLAFPGIFRGTFDVNASDINEEMKIAAAEAIASLISDEELNPDYIIPSPFDERVGQTVAKAVAQAARDSGASVTLVTGLMYVRDAVVLSRTPPREPGP